MPAPIKKIHRFLESCLDIEENVGLVLYSINVAGRRSRVWKSHGKWSIDNIAPNIVESSQEAANGFGKTTRFALHAFKTGDEDRSTSILNISWALLPVQTDEPEDKLAEKELIHQDERAASDSELIAQLTRHNIELLQILAKR